MATDRLRRLEIVVDTRIFLYAILIIALGSAAWLLRGVVVMFFLAFIINSGLRPLVDKLSARRIPRALSIFIIYFVMFVIFTFFTVMTTNTFINQIQNLVTAMPKIAINSVDFVENNIPALAEVLPTDSLREEIQDYANGAENSKFLRDLINRENVVLVVAQAYGLFGGAVDFTVRAFTVLMVAAYLLNKRDNFYDDFLGYFPARRKQVLKKTLEEIEKNMGSWLIGQVSLMLLIGVFTYLILIIPSWFFSDYTMHQYALPIAIIAGFLEAIPNLGPFLTAVFASIIAIGTSGLVTVIYIVILFMVLQNLQATAVTPIVLKKAVGIDPIVSILGIIAGVQLYGILGALLVIPIIAILKIVVTEIVRQYAQ